MIYNHNNTSKILLLIVAVFLNCMHCKKPNGSKEQAVWRVECELGLVVDPECPVDGGWAPWGPWSACRGACDGVGERHRARTCTSPPPSREGVLCRGPADQLEPCYVTNCSLDDFRTHLAGDPVRLDALRRLSATPALADRCLRDECPYEVIMTAVTSDDSWRLNPETMWNSLQCVKRNIGCSVAGGWGSWSAWSACSAGCGRGARWRLRRCDAPPPSSARMLCHGTPLHGEPCEGDRCVIDHRNVLSDTESTWADWNEWSACSERCGSGVRRRRRLCKERERARTLASRNCHCNGEHDQLEVCRSKVCFLEGGWSGWSAWGPCSRSCGAGRRSRVRTCTRPEPAGGGAPCPGPRTDFGACYLAPCETYTHLVAILNGESFLVFNFVNKRSALFHTYIRFMPLSPHGTLVRRGSINDKEGLFAQLSLHRWRLCVEASGPAKKCAIARSCSAYMLDPATWHSAVFTITGDGILVRIDNTDYIKGTFPCDPELVDEPFVVHVGERYHGELQEIIVNFIPLNFKIEKRLETFGSSYFPNAATNIAYEKAAIEEGFVTLQDDQYMRLPCFWGQDEWILKLTIMPKRHSGLLLFLVDSQNENSLSAYLQNNRLKMKLTRGDLRTETISTLECPCDEWLDISFNKKKQSNTIEAVMNDAEHLHIAVDGEESRNRSETYGTLRNKTYGTDGMKTPNFELSYEMEMDAKVLSICDDEFFLGGVPETLKWKLSDDMAYFTGIIASLRINGVLQDLLEFSVERQRNDIIQVSSRTASISGSYHEAVWGQSGRLNLTCLHARSIRSPQSAYWLYLDTGIESAFKDKMRSVEDGRVLRLVATADNNLRGFYTCRARVARRVRNVATYGVIGQALKYSQNLDTTTVFAIFTSLTLVATTLCWLIFEALYDLRHGHGFFRDLNISPKEEAEAMCKFIDMNSDEIGSKSAVRLAKARARSLVLSRRVANEESSVTNFELKDKTNDILMGNQRNLTQSPLYERCHLPTIQETIKNQTMVYRCESSYINPLEYDSRVSLRRKLNSGSSYSLTSPCVKRCSLKDNSLTKKSKPIFGVPNQNILSKDTLTQLTAIKSFRDLEESPGRKVLLKFQELYEDD